MKERGKKVLVIFSHIYIYILGLLWRNSGSLVKIESFQIKPRTCFVVDHLEFSAMT